MTAMTRGRQWRRRAHLGDLALLGEALAHHEDRPVRELARTLASEASRASRSRARWLTFAALELAGLLGGDAPVELGPGPATGDFELTSHLCHVPSCRRPAKPRYLMCKTHWFRVPRSLRTRVLAAYRVGQEVDRRPTETWLAAATAAIAAVSPKRFGAAGQDC